MRRRVRVVRGWLTSAEVATSNRDLPYMVQDAYLTYIAAALGVPVDSFAFWQWAGPRRALQHSVLADVSSLMDIGMILGAGAMAASAGGLRRREP